MKCQLCGDEKNLKTMAATCVVCGTSSDMSSPFDFRALDRWANMNSPIWNAVSKLSEGMGMNETDRLQMLCFLLLKQNLSTERQLIALAQKYGFSS